MVAVPIATAPAARRASSASAGGIPNVKLKTGGGSSIRTASWASNRGSGCGGGEPGPRPRRSRHGPIRRSIASTASGAAGVSTGANRLTANGASVSARIAASWARNSSGASIAPPSEPSPPAFETAATSSGVLRPAIGAWTIG